MKTLKTWLITIAVLLCSATVSAYDFEVDGIYYNILSASDKTVEVTNPKIWDGEGYTDYYKGNMTIPSTVTFNNMEFVVTTIGDYAFSPNEAATEDRDLISVTISEGITTIGNYAFYSNINLETVNFPQSLESIGNNAFYGCSNLNLLEIPKGLESIGNYAFSSCPLIYIKITGSTSIGYGAFSELKIAWLPTNTVPYIEGLNGVYSNTKFILEYGTKYIDDYYGWVDNTFDYQMSGGDWYLANIIMYDPTFTDAEIQTLLEAGGEVVVNGVKYSVTSLYGTFKLEVCGYEEGLTSADIASKITYLNREFTVTSIKNNAFANATSLTTVKIPSTITSIGTNAFVGCTAITSVTTERATPLSINDGCFDAMAQLFATLNVPIGSLSAYQAADVWKGFGTITEAGISSSILTLTANEGGTIACGSTSVSKGSEYVSITGNSAIVTFTPDTYYTLTKVSVDGTDVTSQVSNGELTISMSADTKVVATFGPKSGIQLSDEEEFELANNISCEEITYTRTLNNLLWNALYVPFEIPVSQLTENYDIAYINAMHSYDMDDNGAIDKMEMEVVKIKEGTLHANYPYLIRAKNEEAKAMEIVVENSTLYAAESVTVDCSSVFTKFEITGTYQPLTNEEIDGCRALSDGTWKTMPEDATLNPFRLYMRISDREGSPVKVDTYALEQTSVTIRVQGENPGTTSIESEEIRVKNEESDATIYNLMGQPVKNPVKGHIYIQGGRKVVW